MDNLERTASSSPTLGVTPPSSKSLHNSTRCAPPRPAATAEATESTQTSMSTCSVMIWFYEDRTSCPLSVRKRPWLFFVYSLGGACISGTPPPKGHRSLPKNRGRLL